MKFSRQWWTQLKAVRTQQKDRDGWTAYEVNGAMMMLDRNVVKYLESKAPQPTQQSLDAVLEHARSFRLIKGGLGDGQPLGNEVLLAGNDQVMLSELRQVLRIIDCPAGHCMCSGDPTLEFQDEVGKQVAVICVHHGDAIRWDEWCDDADLVDGLGLMKWLAAHGVQYPLQQYQAKLQRGSAAHAAWQRWFAAMPSCLQPLLAGQEGYAGMLRFVPSPSSVASHRAPQSQVMAPKTTHVDERRTVVKQVLEKAYPDAIERARALLVWYAHGVGIWSGYPGYETTAENALLDTPIDGLLGALQGSALQPLLLEGAARFLAGWDFATTYGHELGRLPTELRQQLLKVGLETTNEDRMERAKAAFSSRPQCELKPQLSLIVKCGQAVLSFLNFLRILPKKNGGR